MLIFCVVIFLLWLFQSSHLAMIDTLMMAYTVEMVSVERVLTCIQKFTPFIPEDDFPYDSEEAIITWINKVRVRLWYNLIPKILVFALCQSHECDLPFAIAS